MAISKSAEQYRPAGVDRDASQLNAVITKFFKVPIKKKTKKNWISYCNNFDMLSEESLHDAKSSLQCSSVRVMVGCRTEQVHHGDAET